MIAGVETIKNIIKTQGLKYLVCYDMAQQCKLHQAEDSIQLCCDVLDEVTVLMGNEPFRVEAWAEKNEGGGKPSKLAKTFKWILRSGPAPAAAMNYHHATAQTSPELVQAIAGLTARLDAMEAGEEEEEEEVPNHSEWIKPAVERAFALADRFLGLQPPTQAAMNGATAPAADVDDAEFVKACLLARKDPGNAAFVNQLMQHYGSAKK
jgi:hypothetical protein